MSKPKVVILGCTGMLGSITLDSFVHSGGYDVIATYRDEAAVTSLQNDYPSVEFRSLDAEKASDNDVTTAIAGAEWVVNAIGVIKPYIHDDNAIESERAIRINGLFPYALGKAAADSGAKVIQIATDCVYSGQKGKYVESDLHDAIDVYGKSKSLGEAYLDTMIHIRCSIIGPELKGHLSLLDWFLGQEKSATLNGYTNHVWNGVTTLQFARLCQGIISRSISLPHLQHVIPGNLITKSDLLKCFAKEFGRDDITVNPVEAPKVIDRTLETNDPALNEQLWQAAGYDTPPTVEAMVAEVAKYGFPGKQTA